MSVKHLIFILSMLVASSVVFAEERSPYEGQQDKKPPYRVVTTIAQLAEPLSLMTGDCVVVESLLGSGMDPHLYRLTRADIVKLRSADMILYVGHLLEAQMVHLLDDLAASKPVHPLGELIDEEYLLEVAPAVYDPHLWMDPMVWLEVLELAITEIATAVPDCRASINQASTAYFTRLRDMDRMIVDSLSRVPDHQRILVTSHDAFGYFGRRYDIEVLAIQGLSTDRQISVRKVDELVDQLIARGVDMVFIESSVSDRDMRAVIEGASQQGHYVRLGGVLFSDAMGHRQTEEGTYLGMLAHNVHLIASSFGIRLSLNDRLPNPSNL